VQEKRPALRLKGSCVGSCARALLMSGAPLQIEPGTVIAFGGLSGVGAVLKEQIDTGSLFIADERSQASRERLLASYKDKMDKSLALRELQEQLAPLPADSASFIAAAVGGWRVDGVSFMGDNFHFRIRLGRQRCLWWLPDAEGLKQLGLDIAGYQPVSRAEAAKLLDVAEQLIYAGPMLAHLPEKPLCSDKRDSPRLPMLP